MRARLDPRKAAPEAMKAMSDLHGYVRTCGLDQNLVELVKLRASQINNCAWCMDMHTKALRAAGEDEQRIYLLSAWTWSSSRSRSSRSTAPTASMWPSAPFPAVIRRGCEARPNDKWSNGAPEQDAEAGKAPQLSNA